ncbi:hypothetical protein NEIRO03_0786 [Nematocida sp. AWRm78]|nr:hypothetical protein NEIRO03_0786 [Nematocida sp. AWRm78]
MEMNWDKVRIAQREIKILGHILSENRLRPLDERITEIMKMPVPRNQKQVRSFLERVNYMGRHIRDLSELKAPLNDFTLKYRRGEDMIIADDLSRMYEGPSYESAPPNCEAIIMALQLEIAGKVLKLHEELYHRKTILKDLESRGIKISVKELRGILATCRTCLERDNQFSKHNAYIDTSAPGELMGIDLMTYQKGHVLVMIDYYTRMAFAQDLVRKDANSVLSVIKKIFTQFPFKKIIADHGREFDNTTVQTWAGTNQVEIYYHPAYYYQGTGRIKRLIQTLRKALNRTKGPLRAKLGSVVKGYNRTVHRAIGTSPEMALYPSRHAAVNEAVERYKLEFGKSNEPPLRGGQRVLVRKDIRYKDDKHFEEEGVVSEKQGFNSYLVKLQDGTDVIKNRGQLKPLD